MANYTQTSKNFTGQFMTGIQGLNTGLIIPWGAASVPSGFLECNGAAVSRSTYAALFAVISTTYGIGDGTTTFNLPDLTDRTIVNKSNTKSLAQTGGANTVTPTGNIGGNSGSTILTTAELAAHTHTRTGQNMQQGGGCCSPPPTSQVSGRACYTSGSTGGGGGHSHTLTGSFTGSSMSVLQPYLVLIYIIKT